MLDALLARGYFPGELPPLFSTVSFALAIKKANQGLPDCMKKIQADWTQQG